MKKLVPILCVLLLSVFIVSCQNGETQKPTSSQTNVGECTEPANGVTINPDPAFLNQEVTIFVPCSSGIINTLESITIYDSMNDVVKQYGWQFGGFPNGVSETSSEGWEWIETFTTGEPGRWRIVVKYRTTLSESGEMEGSFCVNSSEEEPTEITTSEKIESRKILFCMRVGQNREIFILHLDGRGYNRLTDNSSNDKYPLASPNGEKIVFSSDRKGNYDIYVMNINGDELTRLTDDINEDTLPSWSPDGKKIAYFSHTPISPFEETEWYLCVMNTDGSNKVKIADSVYIKSFSWSPDGKKIVYVHNLGDYSYGLISTVNIDGTELKVLTEKGEKPSWSPDGKKIAYLRNSNLYIMNSDGSEPIKVLEDVSESFSWSPDGKSFAVDMISNGNFEIFVVNIDGTGLKNLTNRSNHDQYPVWSPDGERIAFFSNVPRRGYEICTITDDGLTLKSIEPVFSNIIDQLSWVID